MRAIETQTYRDEDTGQKRWTKTDYEVALLQSRWQCVIVKNQRHDRDETEYEFYVRDLRKNVGEAGWITWLCDPDPTDPEGKRRKVKYMKTLKEVEEKAHLYRMGKLTL